MKVSLPKEAIGVMKTLKDAGYQAYVVGGCVRDLMLDKQTKDWDFATNATPEEIRTLFPDSFYDNTYGTVGVPIRHNDEVETVYEITTFRSESEYTDHRHPDKIVWGKTIEEDLERRDFTINALAYDGELIIDLYQGMEDMKLKLIRAVRDPNLRFHEDALRMMRAVRFATQLQFMIEPQTFEAIRTNAPLLEKISWERIRDELLKILASPFPADGIKLLRNAGLLNYILPELEACFGVEQKSPGRHHIHDVGTHLVLSLEKCPSGDPIVRLATLLHDIGKPKTAGKMPEGTITFYNHEIVGGGMVKRIADRLRLSKKQREKLYILVRFHQFTVDERQTDSAVRRFIRNVGVENIDDMLALRTGDRLGGGARETSWRLELFKKRIEEVQVQPFSVSDLKISGHDVMKELDIKPGPQVGQVLKTLFDRVVEGQLPNEREILLAEVNKLKVG